MADLATLDDLRSRLLGRDLTADEESKVPALLGDATALILARFPWIDTEAPPPAVTGICCAMVLRVMRNPGGLRSVSIDDYAQTIDSAQSTGELYLTEREERAIQAVRGAAFEIVLGPPPEETVP